MNAPQRHLLLERGGVLWGIASREVRRVSRHRGGLAIELASGEQLAADDARGVVAGLEVTPLAPLLARFWPHPALGLATHDRRPLVVVGGGALPETLLAAGTAKSSTAVQRAAGKAKEDR